MCEGRLVFLSPSGGSWCPDGGQGLEYLSSPEDKPRGKGMLLCWSQARERRPLLRTEVGDLEVSKFPELSARWSFLDSLLSRLKSSDTYCAPGLQLILQPRRPRLCLWLRFVWNYLQISGLCFWLDSIWGATPLTQQKKPAPPSGTFLKTSLFLEGKILS